MRVLKVVAGTSTGSTVFELGRKAKSYDWDKAELLTDCLSQVFFGTGSFWSGNIEVYFELKGKLFCAGKRMQAGKSENYLAGEDDGNLTVYAEDYEGVLKYLGDFVGGDFLRYLQTVFVTAKDVGDFVSDNGRAILGDLVYAAKEAESDFDEKKFRELEEERARLEDIADASRLFARSAALKGVLDEKKKKAEELSALREELGAKKEIAAEKSEFDEARARHEQNRASAEKAKDVIAFREDAVKLKEILSRKEKSIEESKELDVRREDAEKQDEAAKEAVAYSETLRKYTEYKSKADELDGKVSEAEKRVEKSKADADSLEKAKKAAEESYAKDSEKRKKEFSEARKNEEKKYNDTAVAAKKAIATENDTAKAEKTRLAEVEKKLPEAENRAREAKSRIDELEKTGYTQESYDKFVSDESVRRADYDKQAENIRRENEEAKKAFEDEKAFVEHKKEEIAEKRALLSKEKESFLAEKPALENEKSVALYDVNPKNRYEVTKKYFGMGYNPTEFNLHLKSLKGRIAAIDARLSEIDARIKAIDEEIKGLKEPSLSVSAPEVKEIPEYKSLLPIDTTGFTALQLEYYDKLTVGEADEMLCGERKLYEDSAKEAESLSAEKKKLEQSLSEREKTVRKLNDEVNEANRKITENAKKQFAEEKFVFADEDKLSAARKELDEANEELERARKEREALPQAEKPAKCSEAAMAMISVGKIAPSGKAEETRSLSEEKKKEISELEKDEETLRAKLDGRNPDEYAVGNDEADRLSAEIKAFEEEGSRLSEEEKKFEGLPADITRRIAVNEKEIAENDEEILEAEKSLTEVAAGITASREAQARLKATDSEYKKLRRLAAEERKFASSAEAKKVVKKFNDGLGKMLAKMTDGRLTAKLEDCLRITENGEVIALSWLGSTDKTLVYVAVIKNAPCGEDKISNSLVVCGDVDMDRDLFLKCLSNTSVTLKTSVDFIPSEKPARKRKAKTSDAASTTAEKPEVSPTIVENTELEKTTEEKSEVSAAAKENLEIIETPAAEEKSVEKAAENKVVNEDKAAEEEIPSIAEEVKADSDKTEESVNPSEAEVLTENADDKANEIR